MSHSYAITDYRGWQPVYLEQLIYLHEGVNRFQQLKDESSVQPEWYPSPYVDLGKPCTTRSFAS